MTSNTQSKSLAIDLTLSAAKIDRFTTLLQSGIKLPVTAGMSLGVFIDSLPGFDIDYVSNVIQTIFLDGNAIDDLEYPLTRHDHVLALSAAMPGLAGAIFRRNSLCAALRTRSDNLNATEKGDHKLFILLKLFNTIALEKGGMLLQSGGIFSGKTLFSFFQQRPFLLDAITSVDFDGKMQAAQDLLPSLSNEKQYYLKINTTKQQDSQ
jgi:hypothetical protein